MPTTIKLKNSVTTTNAPSSLVQGEVAINITDKKVWVGNAATTPIQLLGDGGSASFTSIAFGAGTVSSPSITFTGDTNTGIYSPAADTIAFTEGGVESMRITSAGNVGIGTNNPSYKLDVRGTMGNFVAGASILQTAIDSTNSINWQVGSDGSNIYIGTQTNHALRITTNNAERMRIDSSGNVGIGTTSPSNLLHVSQASSDFQVRVTGTSSGNAGSLRAYNNGGEATGFGTTGSTNSGYGANLGFMGTITNIPQIFITNNTERMRITSGGDVGIGTTSPDSKLNIQANSSAGTVAATPSIVLSNRSTTNATFLGGGIFADFYRDVSDPSYAAGMWFERDPASGNLSSSGNIVFGAMTNGSTSPPTERMRLNSAGALLVGATSQYNSELFNVTSSNSANNARVINIYNSSATSTTRLNNQLIRIASNASSADVCINFTDSVAKNYYYGGNNGGAYVVAGTNGVRLAENGTSWASDSDERVKDIIEPITDAAHKVSQLRSVIGKYKTDEEGIRRPFLIAQDVQAVLPEAVFDEQGTLMLAYTDTIPLLVAAIKEQQAMIEELKQEVAKIKGV